MAQRDYYLLSVDIFKTLSLSNDLNLIPIGKRRVGKRRVGKRRVGKRRVGKRRVGKRRVGKRRVGKRRVDNLIQK